MHNRSGEFVYAGLKSDTVVPSMSTQDEGRAFSFSDVQGDLNIANVIGAPGYSTNPNEAVLGLFRFRYGTQQKARLSL